MPIQGTTLSPSIKNMQFGYTTVDTQTTVNISITAVDRTKTVSMCFVHTANTSLTQRANNLF